MKVIDLLKAYIFKFRQNKWNIRKYTLAGTELYAFPGTIRPIPDKDDNWYYHLAKNSKIIVDVGCNVGYSGLLALASGTPKKIVFIDANTEALSKAAVHMIYNGFSENSSFVNSLVSDVNGEEYKFYTVGTGAAGSIYKDHAQSASLANSWYWVKSRSLDNICSDLNFIPDLVKVDVEGAEALVLLGASEIAELYQPAFFIEMHKTKELSMVSNTAKVLKWCTLNNYNAWYLSTGKKISNPNILAKRGRCHILLLPIGKKYPKFLGSVKEGSEINYEL